MAAGVAQAAMAQRPIFAPPQYSMHEKKAGIAAGFFVRGDALCLVS
jgi:hypothetical protein